MSPFSLFLSFATLATATPFAHLVQRPELRDSYDYVVVGGGLAGLTVADRLSEDLTKTVLVIESGELDRRDPGVLVPGLLSTFGEPPYMFNITSVPQPGLNNRSVSLLAAHVLAGGSVVNGMFFDRGSPGDYDIWEELGNDGWGWNGLFPYFKKSERFTPPKKELLKHFDITFDRAAHGFTGAVNSSYPNWIWPGVNKWFAAFKNLGIRMPKDGTNDGLGAYFVSNSLKPDNQSRSYARDAHFEPSIIRPNYHVLLGTTVTKVLLDGNTTAVGVEFATSKNDTVSSVAVNKEVIISAGASHTPQVLFLSGIGPSALLSSLNIPVIVDLPGVGQNLQEHGTASVGGARFENDLPINPSLLANATFAAEQLARYFENRTGPYTFSFGASVAMTTLSDFTLASNTTALLPSLQSQSPSAFLPPGTHPDVIHGFAKQKRLLERRFKADQVALTELAFDSSASLPVVIAHPLSRGSITINSTSAFDSVVIDWRTLSNPFDLDTIIAGTKLAYKLLDTAPLTAMRPVDFNPPKNSTEGELEAYMRNTLLAAIGHVSCSAPMMPREDGGVVDNHLRVHGVRGLRVVDASIMPVIPATHLMSTVYAIAEKAGDLIKHSQ